ncbi:MAG: transposase [bacterium]|nr:transposase [bacterium]
MPCKNRVKQLAEGAYYHAYNRGYHRQQVFLNEHDYHTFIHILKKYLDPDFRETKFLPNGEAVQIAVNKPLYEKVELHSYCLMPNHFHLLVKQISKDGMSRLINVVCSQYSTYFNNKYEREGTIWQGTYKAVIVKTEEQYLHLSRYIHLNPFPILHKLEEYPYSSYPTFIGKKKFSHWFKPEGILHSFTSKYKDTGASYQRFVEGYHQLHEDERRKEEELIQPLILDEKT